MQKRNCFLLLALTFSTVFGNCLAQTDIDEGLGALKINARKSFIDPVLVATSIPQLWYENLIIDTNISGGCIYDHRKAGIFKYCGLKIARVEVYFCKAADETDKVYSFFLWCEKPIDEKKETTFIDGLTAKYGEPSAWPDEETGKVIRMEWFSETTHLTVSLGKNAAGKPQDYYIAGYESTFGG